MALLSSAKLSTVVGVIKYANLTEAALVSNTGNGAILSLYVREILISPLTIVPGNLIENGTTL
jgi:hypothetical protein